MSALRIGVVGAGSMGRAHVAAIARTQAAKVVAICDTDAGRRDALASEFALPTTRDLESLLQAPVDAVIVATPESAHGDPLLRSLRAGKHVLVEKPLATDVAEAHRLAEAAERAGTVVMVGFNLRYDERHREVRDWLQSAHCGDLVSMYLRRNRPAALFRTYQRVHPGFESTSHDVDLVRWLTGRRVRTVFALHRQRPGDANPFGLWSLMELDDGTVVTTEGAWSIPDGADVSKGDLVEVIGSAGTVHVDVARQTTTFWDDRGVTELDRPVETSTASPYVSIDAEIADFVRCATEGRGSSWASLSDAVHAVEVVDGMIRSARSGRPITLGGPECGSE